MHRTSGYGRCGRKRSCPHAAPLRQPAPTGDSIRVVTVRGLVKVSVDAPARRVDLALPDRWTLAEVLPTILRHAGDELADEGTLHGGWILRRHDGSALENHKTLVGQHVLDGEVLLLVPAQQDWPDLQYDDIVDAIATASRGSGREWGPAASRRCGLTVGAIAALTGLGLLVRPGPPWGHAAWYALGIAVALMVAAVLLSRAVGDAVAGTLAGTLAVAYAGVGGALLLAGRHHLSELGAPHLITASAAMLLAGLAGYAGVGRHTQVFAGASTVGLLGACAGWLATTWLDGTRSAAVIATVALALLPLAGPLALRIGRLPKPVLPRTAADLIADPPHPPRPVVSVAVLRAAAAYTGLLGGLSVTVAACLLPLARSGSTAARLLAVLAVTVCLLRSRLLPGVIHRVCLLVAGLAGAAWLLLLQPTGATVAGLLLFAGAATFAGLRYSRRTPNAYLGRYAEFAETLAVFALVPVLMSVLGLYGYVRGLGG